MRLAKSSSIATSIALSTVLLAACGGAGGSDTATTTETPTTPSPSGTPTPSPTPTPPGGPVPTPTPGVTVTPTPTSPPTVGVVAGRFSRIPTSDRRFAGEYFGGYYPGCVRDLNSGLTWQLKVFSGTNYDSLVARQTYIPPAYPYGPESYGYATQSQIDDLNNVKLLQQRANYDDGGNNCGFTNWRLPTESELLTLRKPGTTNQVVDETLFTQNLGAIYWTSTNVSPPSYDARGANLAKVVDFRGLDSGFALFQDGRWNSHNLMFVRN